MSAIAKDLTVHIQEIEQKSTVKGKSYWLIKDGDHTFKTWSQKVAAAADALKDAGKPAFVIYHEDTWTGREGREFTDLMVDELKPGEEKNVSLNGSSDKMSKAEWDSKEDREHVRRLYVSHLIQMTHWWSTVELSERPSYNDLSVAAKTAAVHDLEWIRKFATGEPPF